MSEQKKYNYNEDTGATTLSNGEFHAPFLIHEGKKDQFNTTNQTYQIPQKLADILFRELGDKSAQLRIMMVLCGTKPNFVVTTKWMLERTGLSQQSYNRARKELCEDGWIDFNPYGSISVDFDFIYNHTTP